MRRRLVPKSHVLAIFFYITDTGVETKLNELQISLTPRSNCSSMWSGSILNTHICVGNGKIGACNVSRFNFFFFANEHSLSVKINEPMHEISNNVVCVTSKPQISLRIRAV